MIIYYWGDNYDASRRAARAEFLVAREQYSEAPVFDLADGDSTFEVLREAVSARSLLGGRVIAFFDRLSANSDLTDFITEQVSDMVSSENIFIFSENEKGEALARLVEKAKGKVKEFKLSEVERAGRVELANRFIVADALGNRDRKQAWLLYHDALRQGVQPEEIFWKFAWKVKTLLLVATAPAGSPLPLKPYPLSQAKRQLKNYKIEELIRLSSRFTKLYHEARRGLADFDSSLERLILEA